MSFRDFLARRLIFALIPFPELVKAATRWRSAEAGLDDQSVPQWPIFFGAGQVEGHDFDEVAGVKFIYEMLLSNSDLTLQVKLNEVELSASHPIDRVPGYLPVGIDDADISPWLTRQSLTAQQTAFLSLGLNPSPRLVRSFNDLPLVAIRKQPVAC